ncbi:MAG: SAM-dependent methyltransferase [Kangiellaceae bacterium]|jgi:2-polyprenyl-3-methyl-5-hydroxy-6-metoxy-1,4-benzoquinol methylase|nr:SAM-dependent methyltransferase [Kangiellaceae bacterium]|tara:strand:- start:2427 stop:3326 length:900 start_codon:yes stop_codon:yes gene_type:complete
MVSKWRKLDLDSQLVTFIQEIPQSIIARDVSVELGVNSETISFILDTFVNEAIAAYRLVSPFLSKDKRILEVGAGICVLSAFLAQEGYDIVALEPDSSEFEVFGAVRAAILKSVGIDDLNVLNITAQELTPLEHGTFDIIFSNNVLEHIPDLELAIEAMGSVLKDDGTMFHVCPNYIVPYEPHLQLPIIKICPMLTRALFPKKVASMQAVWDSLNFITYFKMKKVARDKLLDISFQKGVLYDNFDRLEHDSVFRERHSDSMIPVIYYVLKVTRLIKLVKYFPAFLSSPMQFTLRKPEHG